MPIGATPTEASSQGVPPGWPNTPGAWVSDPLAQWISPQADVVAIPGQSFNTFYTYQTSFDLTGFDLSSVQISGHFTADNYVSQVALNGVPIFSGGGCGSNSFAFQNLTPFTASSGFVSGVNTLSFNVTNDVCNNTPPSTNPTGLIVDVAGTANPTAVPEPMMALPSGLALAFAAFLYRRRGR